MGIMRGMMPIFVFIGVGCLSKAAHLFYCTGILDVIAMGFISAMAIMSAKIAIMNAMIAVMETMIPIMNAKMAIMNAMIAVMVSLFQIIVS